MLDTRFLSRPPLPHYAAINDFLAAAGFAGRTHDPNFYAVRLEDTYPHVRAVMPPFRKDFYLLAVAENPNTQSVFTVDGQDFAHWPYYLVVQSPGHTLAWRREPGLRGYLVYFRPECLALLRAEPANEFPFFDLLHTNSFRLDGEQFAYLRLGCEQLLAEPQPPHAPALAGRYGGPVRYAQLLALLYRCRGVYEALQESYRHESAGSRLVQRFAQALATEFLTRRTVDAYAAALAVTPSYLNEVLKRHTGRSAYRHIADKLLREAQALIRHTPADVAEIAYQLNFSGPAQFAKFFKRETGLTPSEFRRAGVASTTAPR